MTIKQGAKKQSDAMSHINKIKIENKSLLFSITVGELIIPSVLTEPLRFAVYF